MRLAVSRGALVTGLILAPVLYHGAYSRPSAPSWPPAPRNMVYRDWTQHGGGLPSLPGGSALSIYEVPANKWFVLTAYHGGGTHSLVENLAGNTVVKVGGAFLGSLQANSSYASVFTSEYMPIGVAFRPGSHVEIRSNSAFDDLLTYAFSGYLTDSDASYQAAWPPQPQNIITVDSENLTAGGQGITLGPLESHTVYTVPVGKALVLTNIETQISSGTVYLGESWPSGSRVRLATFSNRMFGPPIGLTYGPGSKVTLMEAVNGSITGLRYVVSGYLVDH